MRQKDKLIVALLRLTPLYTVREVDTMNQQYENMYKVSRIRAGLKREPAAEELSIAVRTLDKYESGELRVPDDVVKRMCRVYRDGSLAYRHLKAGELGEFLPDISMSDSIQTATISVLNDRMNFDEAYREIIKTVADGKIDIDERRKWEDIRKTLLSFAASLIDLATERDDK